MELESNPDRTAIAHPLLFQCDKDGRVLWMSEQARAAVGKAPLMQAAMDCLRKGRSFRIWPAYDSPDALVFAAQPENAVERAPAGMSERWLRNYARLEKAVRRLDEFRRTRASARAGALFQIELERRRLGRELHTGVGQLLAAIRLQLDVVSGQLSNPPEAVEIALERIGRLSEEALEQVRGVSRRLYAPDWQRLTLADALRGLWETAAIPQRFAASLRIETPRCDPAHEIKVFLYRAAQEALANISRHSGATRVAMTLETSDDRLILTIHDDGRGFDAAAGTGNGLGLRSIRDAARETGADFRIESAPGSTTLRVSAPFAAQ